MYRYHKDRITGTNPDSLAICRYRKPQFIGHSTDNTNPHSRAMYRNHKARHTGTLSISQSSSQEHCIDITKPDLRALYRYHITRLTGTLSISHNPTHRHSFDITNPDSQHYIDITKPVWTVNQICGAQDNVMLYVLFNHPVCGSYQALVTKIHSSVAVHFPFRSVSC